MPARAAKVTVIVLVAGMVAMWGYVLYLAIGPGRADPPDRLDDPTFAMGAQVRCRDALDQIALLPRAIEADTNTERADSVEQANAHLDAMLTDLEALIPDGVDGELVSKWLADWRTYLGDRAAYATALRNDPEARLLVTAKDHEQITEHLDAFAADNRMPSCSTPLDV